MKEEEIRPAALFDQYLRLSKADADKYFRFSGEAIGCPACGNFSNNSKFEKYGFHYSECDNCRSVYNNPRPPNAAFNSFYASSASAKFWSDVFLPAVEDSRRDLMFRPKVEEILKVCGRLGIATNTVLDAGAGVGLFLDAWRDLDPKAQLLAVEPSRTACHTLVKKGYQVFESTIEEIESDRGLADLVVSLEVLEHVHCPADFVRGLYDLTHSGGITVLTSLCIDGFDLQLLGSRSKSFSPPHHINFLSKVGYELLFKNTGYKDVEIFTPGKLDVEIVCKHAKENPSFYSRYEGLLRMLDTEPLRADFQKFLSKNKLSSHIWVVATK